MAKTKADKGYVIQSIMDQIKSQGGTFVRPDPRSIGGWWVVDEATAREKVGSNIRAIIKAMGGEAAVIAKLKRMEKQDSDCSVQTKFSDLTYRKQQKALFNSSSSEENPLSEPIAMEIYSNPKEYVFQEMQFFEGEGSIGLVRHSDQRDDSLFDWIPDSVVSVGPKEQEPLPF
jgi:hypothetical protein